ncbi:hypothetical protein V8F33_005466 [Rhypophila sp. PSN 637]
MVDINPQLLLVILAARSVSNIIAMTDLPRQTCMYVCLSIKIMCFFVVWANPINNMDRSGLQNIKIKGTIKFYSKKESRINKSVLQPVLLKFSWI